MMGVGGGEGDVERRGEMERDDDDHREKRQEKEMCQCEAGAPNNLPADWPDSFHSPAAAPICCSCYCTRVFVHLYV